jgi:TetR/AcrR family transcriptional repressor of nem operon
LSIEATAADRLKAMIGNFAASPIPGGCPIQNTAVDNDDGNQELRILARNAAQQLHSDVERVIKEGIIENEFRTDVNTHRSATLMKAA